MAPFFVFTFVLFPYPASLSLFLYEMRLVFLTNSDGLSAVAVYTKDTLMILFLRVSLPCNLCIICGDFNR